VLARRLEGLFCAIAGMGDGLGMRLADFELCNGGKWREGKLDGDKDGSVDRGEWETYWTKRLKIKGVRWAEEALARLEAGHASSALLESSSGEVAAHPCLCYCVPHAVVGGKDTAPDTAAYTASAQQLIGPL
jgi:hypothetical protein